MFEEMDELSKSFGEAISKIVEQQEAINVAADTKSFDLTKREHFAGLAMQGILAGIHSATSGAWHGWSEGDFAKEAVTMADALLKELEK